MSHWSWNAVTVTVLAPIALENGLDFCEDEGPKFTESFLLHPASCLDQLRRMAHLGILRAGTQLRVCPCEMPDEMYGGAEYGWEYTIEAP